VGIGCWSIFDEDGLAEAAPSLPFHPNVPNSKIYYWFAALHLLLFVGSHYLDGLLKKFPIHRISEQYMP
jgi:hypothetical protein